MARVETYPEAETPTALRRQVWQMQEEAWPSDESSSPGDPGPVHDPALHPLSVLLVDDGQVLCALDVLFKDLVHAAGSVRAAGLSTVVTPTAVRGRGHGSTLVTWAREALADLGVDVGLFTCDRPLAGFYQRCGWELLPDTVLVGGTPDHPFPSDQPGFDKVTVGAFVTPAGHRARATFVGTRVPLHCGSIDKLW